MYKIIFIIVFILYGAITFEKLLIINVNIKLDNQYLITSKTALYK